MAFPKVYNLSAEQVAACKAQLIKLGHEVTEDRVTISKPVKVVLGHKYENGKLVLSLVEKPWYVRESQVSDELDKQIGNIA